MKMRQQVQGYLQAEQDHHMRPPEHDVDFDRRKNYQLIIIFYFLNVNLKMQAMEENLVGIRLSKK